MWTPILNRFDSTSKTLQSTNIDLSIVVQLYESLEKYILDLREMFDNFLKDSQELSGKSAFSWEETRKKKRTAFYDDSNSNSTVHIGKNKIKKDIFYVIIDTLCSNLNERKAAYLVINKNFGFLFDLNRSDTLSVRQSALKIVSIYTEDLNTSFVEEVIQFKKITESFHNNDLSMNGLLKKSSNSPLKATFPNVLIILRIFACMPCTNASGERSFSAFYVTCC
jgi:hypothetical protein